MREKTPVNRLRRHRSKRQLILCGRIRRLVLHFGQNRDSRCRSSHLRKASGTHRGTRYVVGESRAPFTPSLLTAKHSNIKIARYHRNHGASGCTRGDVQERRESVLFPSRAAVRGQGP